MKKSLLSAILSLVILSSFFMTGCFNDNNVYLKDVNDWINNASGYNNAKYTVELFDGSTSVSKTETTYTLNNGTLTVEISAQKLNEDSTGDLYVTNKETKTYTSNTDVYFPKMKEIKQDNIDGDCELTQDINTVASFKPNKTGLVNMFSLTEAEAERVVNPQAYATFNDGKPIGFELTYTIDGFNAKISLTIGY